MPLFQTNNKGCLIDKEVKLYRMLFLFSGVLDPIVGYFWYSFYNNIGNVVLVALLFGLFYISVFFLSYKLECVKNKLRFLLYFSYYLVSAYVLYLAFLNDFSKTSSLLLMIAIFYIILTFNKLFDLLYYLVFILICLTGTLYFLHVKTNSTDDLIIGISFLVFSVIAILNLQIRTECGKALKESHQDMLRLLDSSADGIIVMEKNMQVIYANAEMKKIAGSTEDLVGNSVLHFINQNQHEEIKAGVQNYLANGTEHFYETRVLLPNEKIIDLEIANKLIKFKGKEVLMGTLRDISKRKSMERALMEAESKYRSLVEQALVGVYIYQNDKIVYANPYIEKLCGYSLEELSEIKEIDFVYAEDRRRAFKALQTLSAGGNLLDEFRVVKKDGSLIDVMVQGTVTEYNGAPAFIGTVIDITDRKENESKIMNMAYFDLLTNLPNRRNLNGQLKRTIQDCINNGLLMGVMFIDLDRFKIINDTMGHKFGDLVLQQASKRLSECLREGDFLARYGGDEFIVVLKAVSRDELDAVARGIVAAFNRPIIINGNELFISPSIGISLCPSDSDDAETLIKYADTVMYLAKDQGRNTYRYYFSKLNQEVSRKMQLQNCLRRALELNELIIHYQPLLELSSRKIYAAEALIRWQHPELGLVSPAEFIPLAEETGLIIPIGNWVLENACKQNKWWQEAGLPPICVSVNVSKGQLRDNDFINVVAKVLRETKLDPRYLELEITESIIQDAEELTLVLEELRSMGVTIAIDDFGVGYSSLNMLQKAPVNTLKIDRSFIKAFDETDKALSIVKVIVEMGQHLNFRIIAEGIETGQQLRNLQQIHCGFGQGYLFSRPLPVSQFEKLLEVGYINDKAE